MEKINITKIIKDEIIYTWKIMNFSYSYDTTDSIISPKFSSAISNEIAWYLQLERLNKELKLIICSSFSNISLRNVKISSWILSRQKMFNNNDTFTCFSNFNQSSKINTFCLSELINLLVNDTFTIECRVYIGNKLDHVQNLKKPSIDKLSIDQMRQDFQKLMESEKLTDITLVVNEKKFPAHKAILSARSRVFLALFENDMKEKNENIVHIKDIDCNVMSEMLRFIYTGKVKKLELLADKLLTASDRYGLKDLKEICEEVLCENLTVDNVSATLVLSDLHKCDKLKEVAITFIINNAKSIIETSNFKTLEAKYPSLVKEIFHRILLK